MNSSSTPGLVDEVPLGRNLQIVACAGAGKTEAVAKRVVRQLLEPGVKPANVVAFTFNDRAAVELKERVSRKWREATGASEGLGSLYIGTIHGYCLELLQTVVLESLSFRVLDANQQWHLITRASRKSGLADLGWNRYQDAGSYADLMAILRESQVDRELIDGSPVGECLQLYSDLLVAERYFDFTSLMTTAVEALERDDDLLSRVAGSITFLTVDEYQDVNYLQERLIELLTSGGAALTVVGDDDQLLYGWRGSQLTNIRNFVDRYEDVVSCRLETNYRSSSGVVGLARKVIENNPPSSRLKKQMVSAGNQIWESADIAMREFQSPSEEGEYIASRVLDCYGHSFQDSPDEDPRGLTWADMAVLTRVKSLMPVISEALERNSIPHVVVGVSGLLQNREGAAVQAYFGFLTGRVSESDLEGAWLAANVGIAPPSLGDAIESAATDRRMIDAGDGRFATYNIQRSFMGFLAALKIREEHIPAGSRTDGPERAQVVFHNLGALSQVISDFEQIHFHSNPAEKYKSFDDFLQNQADGMYGEGSHDDGYVSADAVQVMTIHQSKGLQWPAVFVPGLTKHRFPPLGGGGRSPWSVIPDGGVLNADDYESTDEDERRLFYVACTRSKKFLSLTRADYPTPKSAHSTPSPFWYEAEAALADIGSPDVALERPKLSPERERLDGEAPISFSELKYAYECPYSFKLRFIYGFNAPLDEALGAGKGMHDALFELHERVLNGEEIEPGSAAGLVRRHMYLPFSYEELRATISDAAIRRLEGYISARQASFHEIELTERSVELDVGGGVIVTGRIDLVRRRGTGEVVVVDFKSTERAQQEAVTDLQLSVYALAYEQEFGEHVTSVVIEHLNDLSHPVVRDIDDVARDGARDAVLAVGSRLRAASFPRDPLGVTPKDQGVTCSRCDFAGLCTGPEVRCADGRVEG